MLLGHTRETISESIESVLKSAKDFSVTSKPIKKNILRNFAKKPELEIGPIVLIQSRSLVLKRILGGTRLN
jgi:hypothetical protein